MVTTLRFPGKDFETTVASQVFLRASWEDEWQEMPHLHATRVVWCAAPAVPTAELRFRFGQALLPGAAGFAAIAPLSERNRWYVKITQAAHEIEGDADGDPLEWYGILELDGRRLDGSELAGDAGVQFLTAFGLESLLTRQRIYSSYWLDPETGDVRKIDRGLAFNDVPEHAKADGNCAPAPGPETFCFAGSLDDATWWSTYNIVDYLLVQHSPRDNADTAVVEWLLDDPEDVLTNWDRPRLAAHGKTTKQLLDQLMARQRLLSYTVTVGDDNRVLVRPFSFTDVPVELDVAGGVNDAAEVPANPRQLVIALDFDRTASATLQFDSSSTFDRVVARGARRRSVCTLSFADATIDVGWPNDLQLEYIAGASFAAGYPPAEEIEDRQRANAQARSDPRLREVFTRFATPADWSLYAGDGLGGVETWPVFPADGEDPFEFAGTSYPIYRPQLYMLPSLPLLTATDYTEDKLQQETAEHFGEGTPEERRPFVLFPVPSEPERYSYIDRFGDLGALEHSQLRRAIDFSGHVSVAPGDNGIRIELHGAPQHMIAATDFAGGIATDEGFVICDYRDALFTVAFADDRHCLGSWPEHVLAVNDEIRTLDIEAGDRYKQDWCVPQTVVGIDYETGELLRSTSGGWINDDRDQLVSLARLAWEWYSRRRKALSFRTRTITGAIRIGDYIAALNEQHNVHSIDSVVTEIVLEHPVTEGPMPEPPSLQITTSFGELDVLGLVPLEK